MYDWMKFTCATRNATILPSFCIHHFIYIKTIDYTTWLKRLDYFNYYNKRRHIDCHCTTRLKISYIYINLENVINVWISSCLSFIKFKMSFETEHKTIQMEDAISHDQLALEALERRRIALEEVHTYLCLFTRNSILDM